jgi:hypothetical protein
MLDEVYRDYEALEEERPEGYPRDKVIDRAKEELVGFFRENDKDVFYMQQLEVFFEKQFFHWITAKAINELIHEGALKAEVRPLLGETRVKFVFNRRHRYYKRQISDKLRVIREYSDPGIASACGRQGEMLFFNALTGRGFLCHGQHTNEYQGKKWAESDHDLDFIIGRDGKTYGGEVKNKFSYIDEDELDIKLRMCAFLGIRPLFIMRGSPKSYNHRIWRAGGYAMIFETEIFPFAQEELVRRIKQTLALPADCPKAIPDGIIDRFIRWHSGGEVLGA